ncbi:MAG: hypothetical protein ABH860_03820 [bacterium]
MKKILLSILIASLLVSTCYAENLMSALPIGMDNLAIQGFYSSTNVKALDSSLTQFGPRIIYGATEDLDLIGKLAMGSVAGVSSTTMGVGAKYTFLKMSAKDPIDMAGVFNYDSSSSKDYSTSTMGFGVEISKSLRNNFTVYGLLNVLQFSAKATGTASTSSSALQWGGGIKYSLNKTVSFMGELAMFTADNESYSTFSLALQYLM